MNLTSIREVTVHTHKSGLKWIKIAKNGIKKDFYARTTTEVRKKYGIFKQQFEQLNIAYIRDEFDPFIKWLREKFGKDKMFECIGYMEMLKKND